MPTTFSSTTVTSFVSRCARLMLAAMRSMHSSGVHSLLVDPAGTSMQKRRCQSLCHPMPWEAAKWGRLEQPSQPKQKGQY